MFHLLYNPPRHQQFLLACSGGVDSMAAADFFHRGNKNFRLAYFHHATPQADAMMKVVQDYGTQHHISVEVGQLTQSKPKDQSPEEFWRNERYAWLNSFALPIITAHHLNDAVETWLFTALHGHPRVMQVISGNSTLPIYHPFLTNTKQDMIKWCISHQVKWHEDTSNQDVSTPRNRIRHNIIPECLAINAGLFKVIKKKILQAR